MSLKTKLVLAVALTIVAFLGVSGVLTRNQAASFFAEHESRIEQGGKKTAVLAELRQDKRSLFWELAGIRFVAVIAAAGTVSVTLAIVWRRRVSRPIEMVRDRINKMRLGTWTQPILVEQDDEIGTLMREFNDLGPELAFSAHQYAAAAKLAAMALIGQRVVRRTNAAKQRLLAISESMGRRPDDEQFQKASAEQVRLVATELESVAADFDSAFQMELARQGAAGA
jgi:methyl-accepting chemotaxis protein